MIASQSHRISQKEGDEKADEAEAPTPAVSDDGNTPVAPGAASSANLQIGEHAEGDGLVLKRRKPIAAWRLTWIFAW